MPAQQPYRQPLLLLLLLGKLASFQKHPETEEKRQCSRRESEGRKRRASHAAAPRPGIFLGQSLADTEPSEAPAPASAPDAGPPAPAAPQRAGPGVAGLPASPDRARSPKWSSGLPLSGAAAGSSGPEVHSRRHDGVPGLLPARRAPHAGRRRPIAEQASAGAPSTSSGEPPLIRTGDPAPRTQAPPPGLRERPGPSGTCSALGFPLLSSRQRNGRGSSRPSILGRGNEAQRVSNLPEDTQLRAVRARWQVGAPGRLPLAGAGPLHPPRLQLRAAETPLTVPGASHVREPWVFAPAGGSLATLGAPGLWTHHPSGSTTWPLPVCLCPHSIFP